jgi:hypothetical protein
VLGGTTGPGESSDGVALVPTPAPGKYMSCVTIGSVGRPVMDGSSATECEAGPGDADACAEFKDTSSTARGEPLLSRAIDCLNKAEAETALALALAATSVGRAPLIGIGASGLAALGRGGCEPLNSLPNGMASELEPIVVVSVDADATATAAAAGAHTAHGHAYAAQWSHTCACASDTGRGRWRW